MKPQTTLASRLATRFRAWFRRDQNGARARELMLIGRDVASEPSRLRPQPRHAVIAVVSVVVAALAVAALRVDMVRMRYAMADALSEERALEEAKRDAIVSLRQLRNPTVLGARAAELGFALPEQVIEVALGSHNIDNIDNTDITRPKAISPGGPNDFDPAPLDAPLAAPIAAPRAAPLDAHPPAHRLDGPRDFALSAPARTRTSAVRP